MGKAFRLSWNRRTRRGCFLREEEFFGFTKRLARERLDAQFIIATHSPILMAFPGATAYDFDARPVHRIAYEDTKHFSVTRDFLNDREGYLRRLLADEPTGSPGDVGP